MFASLTTDHGKRSRYLPEDVTTINALCKVQIANGEELRPLFGRTLLPSTEGATIGKSV